MIKTSEWKRRQSLRDQEIVWINPVHSFVYQLKLLLLYVHRGLSCEYSFRFEIKETEKCGALIFEYVHDSTKFYRLLHTEHTFDDSRKITLDQLLSDTKSNYSLVKYFYSFQACNKEKFFKDGIIKDFIICTNIDFDFTDLKKFEIEIEEISDKDDVLEIKKNEKKCTRYKFTDSSVEKLQSKLNLAVTDDEIKYFLNHLIFAVNQPNEEELEQIFKQEIGREMGIISTESAYAKLLDKMTDLLVAKGNNMFIPPQKGNIFFNDLKKELPIWYNIQEPFVSFTGRLDYLKQLHDTLQIKSQVCISGIGGVGKTELVRKYVTDFGHEYDNQVVWVNAESYRSAVDSFCHLADKLNISLSSPDGKERHITSIIADIYEFLSKGKSLIIFDNAEKYKCKNEFDNGIDQFLPSQCDNCFKPSVIITSRNHKWPKSIGAIVLEVFTPNEARELVEKMLTFEYHEDKKFIDELGKKLQYLPIALQQAIVHIKVENVSLAPEGGHFEIGNYLEKYSGVAQEIPDFQFLKEDADSYNKRVFSTLKITFDALKIKENGKDALNILNIISYFLPDNIPVELLLTFLTNKEKLSSAIRLLKQYSIVRVQHKTVSVHRLVQQLKRIELRNWNDEITVLKDALKLLDGDTIHLKNVYHVISMWGYAKRECSELLKEYVRIFGYITGELRNCGRIEEAHSIGLEVSTFLAKLSQNNIDVQHGLLAAKYNEAKILLEKCDYNAALNQLQEIEKIMLELPYTRNTKNYSLVRITMAQVLNKLGKNKEALEYYHATLDANRIDLEETHPDILHIKHCISGILSEEGKHQEALSMLQEIYAVQKVTLADRHEETLRTRSEIASMLGKLNMIEDSLKILEEVYHDQMFILPKNHSKILVTKFNIATNLALQGKYSQALKIYQEILDVQKEKLGENHPEVIDIKINIANILSEEGEYERALEIFEFAFDEQKFHLGPMHPATLNTQDATANVFKNQKKYESAIELYADLLDKQILAFGSGHLNTLETRRSIFKILFEQEKYDAALEPSLEVVHHAENIYGKNHPETLNEKINLGTLYCRTRQYKKSLETLMQVLEAQKSFLRQDHEDCQRTIKYITQVLKERGKFGSNEDINSCLVQLRKLLKKDFDINAKDKEGRTMLHHALDGNDERGIELLLQQGADVFVTSNKGITPLHIAVFKGEEKLVKMLLQKIEPKRLNDFVDAKTKSNEITALHVAAEIGHFGIVKYLLKSHATFCPKNKDGKTPLDLSTHKKIINFLKMIHELFENVKRADATDIIEILEQMSEDDFLAVANTRNDEGSTLAQVAILQKQKQVAVKILQRVQKSS